MGSLGPAKSLAVPQNQKNGRRSPTVPQVTNYRYMCMAKAQDSKKPIYDVKFNLRLKSGQPHIFATVGADRINIFECDKDGGLRILQVFSDPEDSFFTCAWTTTPQSAPLLVAAGMKGIIRLLSPSLGTCVWGFVGHTQSINDMLIHPHDPPLLFTASKDHSIRLWNIHANVLVAIFAGVDGHRDEVITLDINLDCTRLISGGMDHAIKVWNLDKPEVLEALKRVDSYHVKCGRSFNTLSQNFPDFSTRDIHGDYVDCVRWFGDLIISKSCKNRIRIWKGGWPLQKWDELKLSDSQCSIIATMSIEECALWYVRFCLDPQKTLLALGNQIGQIYLYELGANEGGKGKIPGIILSHPQCTHVIRQTAFSRDGKILISVCDDGTVWRWDSTGRKRNADFR